MRIDLRPKVVTASVSRRSLDATRPRTLKRVVDQITSLAASDEGGVRNKPRVLIFASLPCVGGCAWQRISSKTVEGGERVESHKAAVPKAFPLAEEAGWFAM